MKKQYETSSFASASLMRAVDFVFQPKRGHASSPPPSDLTGKVVVSSLGGLGDLLVQMPLIEALHQRYGAQVALRPEHLPLAKILGWAAFPFQSPATLFFKAGVGEALRLVGKLWHERKAAGRPDWWVDLTGNAVNNVLIHFLVGTHLAASGLRGGGGLTDLELPETLADSAYLRMEKIAGFLGVEPLNPRILRERLGRAEAHGKIVLVLSTPCRWRNWPLPYFAALTRQFPQEQFILSGFTHELQTTPPGELDAILALPNVHSRLDNTDLSGFVHLLAGARAIVTPDTAATHLAFRLDIPGVALFGPVNSRLWFPAGGGLVLLKNEDCPYFPCVQWHCRRPADWCMNRLHPDLAAQTLRTVLES